MRPLFFKSFLFLTVVTLIILAVDYNFNIHEYIAPVFPVKPLGILIFSSMLAALIISLKKLKREQEFITMAGLIIYGTFIVFATEVVFQFARQFTFSDLGFGERLAMFFRDLTGMTFFGAVLSFFIAYHLKTKNTGRLIGMILIGLMANYIVQKLWF